MTYSSTEDMARFADALTEDVTPTRRPLFVLDMDGNILVGYNLTHGSSFNVKGDSERRGIPADADMDALLRQGAVKAGIFAEKPLDVRLPESLVARMNALEQAGKPFEITILTSRSEADALTILRDSGVAHPEWHTLVADSGAVLRVHGEQQAVRALDGEERAFLDGLDALAPMLEEAVDTVLESQGYSLDGRPRLRLEAKGIATNIHFRELLGHYGQLDDSPLAQGLTQVLEAALQEHIAAQSPLDGGKPAFKLLHGPATLEVKLADIHKGHGLEAVVNAALEHDIRPSSVVFAGDDVCNRDRDGRPSPGTDYYAFRAAPELSRRTGIPMHTVHTLHPANGQLDGTEPDTNRLPPPELAKPGLTVPTPVALAELVDNVLSRCEERAAQIAERAAKRAQPREGNSKGR